MLKKRRSPCECALTGFGQRSTGEASLTFRETGGEGVACCTLVERVLILRLLVQGPFCSMLYEQAQEPSSSLIEIRGCSVLRTLNNHVCDYENSYL